MVSRRHTVEHSRLPHKCPDRAMHIHTFFSRTLSNNNGRSQSKIRTSDGYNQPNTVLHRLVQMYMSIIVTPVTSHPEKRLIRVTPCYLATSLLYVIHKYTIMLFCSCFLVKSTYNRVARPNQLIEADSLKRKSRSLGDIATNVNKKFEATNLTPGIFRCL